MVADFLNHLTHQADIIGNFATLDIFSPQVAQNASEIFMPRERQEASRICHHSYKARKKSHIGQRVELSFHAIFLIQEPPTTSELHLARYCAIAKVAKHRSEDLVI